MDETVFSIMLRRLEEKKSSIELFLAQGGAKSYEDYVRMVGEYSSTTGMIDEVKDLEKRFLED
jgi:hypothetical protein